MGKRSPILGYNHNISHRGLVFHVQTEDSGVDHPHIFTHLFYGGVIIDSRKLDYDAEQAEAAVKSLMQAQHKASLKRLKRGDFDDKIDRYFADDPKLEPRAGAAPGRAETPDPVPQEVGPEATIPIDIGPVPETDISAAFDAIHEAEIVEPSPAAAEAKTPPPVPRDSAAPSPGSYSQHRTGRTEKIGGSPSIVHEQPTMPVARPRPAPRKPAGKTKRVSERQNERGLPSTPPRERRASGGVVVSRPAVIIGAPPKVVGGRAQAGQPARPRPRRFAREDSRGGLFGKDAISEKSLDEVILAYLSEDGEE